MAKKRRWAIIVHGGAKTIDASLLERNRQGCAEAAAAGAIVLRQGGTALAAAKCAIRVLEDNPIFNAGIGSVRNAAGDVEMDAALMDGEKLRLGAVAGVSRVRNPILAAAAMLDDTPALLAGEGAERYAQAHGVLLCSADEMLATEPLASEYSKAHDTVGCVALDISGHVAAATSTGGLPGKYPGRIGDSPLPGCGLYADDEVGGVALSGDGESIMRTMLAAHAIEAMRTLSADKAMATALSRIFRVGGEAGLVAIDAAGRFGVSHNSEHFALGIHAENMVGACGAVRREELEELLDAE